MQQPIIKWSGSKRSQIDSILSHFPKEQINTYYEPFVGGGSVLYGVLKNELCERVVASDLCYPLIDLWNTIIFRPDSILFSYTQLWNRLQKEGQQVYYEIRDRFNKTKNSEDFFFLNRTCFNGLIRFTKNGKFNSPFHLNRNGIDPKRLNNIVNDWLSLFRSCNRIEFTCCDYSESLNKATDKDFVYLDPPYAHTVGMYQGDFDSSRLYNQLEQLNNQGVKWLLSYDGDRYPDTQIPKDLYKNHYLLDSGVSSFSRIKNKERLFVKESLYSNF